MKNRIPIVALIGGFLFLASAGQAATYWYQFTYLDHPLGTYGTRLAGISGNQIVGQYTDINHQLHGFIYNGSSFTTLDDPLASGTTAWGISGNNVVGYYFDGNGPTHGFLYNGSTYTTLDHPLGALGTMAFGIDGNKIVGNYVDSNSVHHAFVYDGSTYTTLNDPTRPNTQAFGISGSTIVGFFSTSNYFGFSYNGTSFTTLPGSAGYLPYGIDGNLIVGAQILPNGSEYGFVYDGLDYTRIDPIGQDHLIGNGSEVEGVSGSTLVGYYSGLNDGMTHGFIATLVPEPTSLLPAGFAGLLLLRRRSSNRKVTTARTE